MFVRSPVPGRARARRAHYLSAANTVGSAYEQAYRVTAMTSLHAWFSGGALTGAPAAAHARRAGLADPRGVVRHRTDQRAFILSPLTIGLIAQATSLRLALALLIPTSLAIACLATRWPSTPTPASRTVPVAAAGGRDVRALGRVCY